MQLKITVDLSGKARENFNEIHKYLENDFLTITSRSTWISPEDRKDPDWQIDHMKTRLQIVGDRNINLKQTVQTAVDNINKIYPNTVEIMSTKE